MAARRPRRPTPTHLGGDPLLTTGQVAEKYGVDRSTVVGWADAELIASIRTIGGHRRVRESDVIRMITDSMRGPHVSDTETTQAIPVIAPETGHEQPQTTPPTKKCNDGCCAPTLWHASNLMELLASKGYAVEELVTGDDLAILNISQGGQYQYTLTLNITP
jgi:excisionase family DNA binding protein